MHAAVGSRDSPGRGTGRVLGELWYYIPWAMRICVGGCQVDGTKVGEEVVGPGASGPASFCLGQARIGQGQAPDSLGGQCRVSGNLLQGYSSKCRLSTTILTATSAVVAALGCTLDI